MTKKNDEAEDLIAQKDARIRDLEALLGQNDDSVAVAFKLTPNMSDLLGLLVAMPNVTPAMICQRLEIATDTKVAIHRLRKALLPWEIKVHSRRNLGYWLDAETKARIKEIVTSVVTPAPTEEAATRAA